MIDEPTMKRIKRLRAYEGLPWMQIEERTGVPHSTAHYAVMGRRETLADRQRKELRKRAATIRMLRKRVAWLEIQLSADGRQGTNG